MTAIADHALEVRVLGLIAFDQRLASTVALEPDDFASPTHQRLWEIARTLARRGRVLTVKAVAAQDGKLAEYLTGMAGLRCRPEELDAAVAALKDAAARRRLAELAEQLKIDAADVEIPVEEIAAGYIRSLSATTGASTGRTKRQVAEAVVNSLAKPARRFSTGLPTLDGVLGGGLYAGKLYGFAARKKVGKTLLLATISHNMNAMGTKHLFLCLEMGDEEIEHRNMAREFGINSVQFLKGEDQRLALRAAEYATTVPDNMIYEHVPGASLDDIRRIVHRAIIQHRIAGVICDYWQLVQGKAAKETEEFHLRTVAQWFADVARKERLWFATAAQVNQDGNTRGGEGLKLACDIYFTLHREKHDDRAWLEMEESRYVLYGNVGTEAEPGLLLDKHGPHFVDLAALTPPPVRYGALDD